MQHYPHKLPCSALWTAAIMHMDRAFKYLNLNGSDKEGTLVPSSVSIIWKTTNHIPSCFQIIPQQRASHFTCTDHSMNLLRSQSWLCFYSGYTDVSTRQRVLSHTSTTGSLRTPLKLKFKRLGKGSEQEWGQKYKAILGFHQCY